MSLRKLKRSIAKALANNSGIKANRKYREKLDNGKLDYSSQPRSGTKIAYDELFKNNKKELNTTATNENV